MVRELLTQRILNLNFLLQEKEKIEDCYTLILETILNDNKILLCGNGEGASISNSLENIFVTKFKKAKKNIQSISLNSNPTLITSIASESSFDDIFKKQIENIGKKGDLLIAFCPIGTNKNIIEAIKQAKFQNIKVILLTGQTKLNYNIDLEINATGNSDEQIFEMHNVIVHTVCELIENNFLN